MNYKYVAFDREGRRVEGRIEASSEAAAEQTLWAQGFTVAQLAPTRRRLSLSTLLPTFFGVKRRDLIVFSRQLATILSSGISILPALELLAGQSESAALQEVLYEVIGGVEHGQSLSAALSAHPLAFPDLYSCTIAVGERTGNLDEVLRRLATYLEKEESLKRKVIAALAYPAFISLLAVGVVVLMLTVAVPPMIDLFESLGVELPWPTRTLVALSRFATSYGPYVLFGGVVLAAISAWFTSRPTGQRLRDIGLLHLPVVGKVVLYGQVSRFARTAAVLIRAGLPLSEAMEMVVDTTENAVVMRALERVRVALLGGHGLSGPLAAEEVFPTLLARMVRVGEETGTLESNLETLADYYEERVDRAVGFIASLVEPVSTIVIGTVVAFIAVSMVLPMYSYMSAIE